MPSTGKSIKTKLDQWLLGPRGRDEEGVIDMGFHPGVVKIFWN